MPSSSTGSSSSSLAFAFLAGASVGSVLLSAAAQWLRDRRRRTKNDDEKLNAARQHLWQLAQHSFTGALIYVGDQLDLYSVLSEQKEAAISASRLAALSGYSSRWLTEWLAQASAAGICAVRQDNSELLFSLRPEYAALLQAPERSKDSLVGLFQMVHALMQRPEATMQAIQTGVGVDYDHGSSILIEGIERKNRNWFQNQLVRDVIKRVVVPRTGEPLEQLLERGANVADIGCGCGSSTLALAKRFPNSYFYGYELSPESLRLFRQRLQESKLTNVTICDVAKRGVQDGPNDADAHFDFVYAHDVLHDMTNPRALMRDVRAKLSTSGCWVIVDVDCKPSLKANISKPSAATSLGFSCLLCLSSATCTHDGEGLGTMGFHATLAREWLGEVGFDHFETMKIQSLPLNSCFVVA